MKKKYFFILVFLSIGLTARSQVLLSFIFGDSLNSDKIEFGLDGGVNWSQITGLDSSSSYRDFNLGFFFDILLKKPWSVYTGVLVKSQLGSDNLSDEDLAFLEVTPQEIEGTYTQRMNYFLVPVMLRYNSPTRIYMEGGLQFGLMYKASVDFESEMDNQEITIKEFNKDKINRIDVGLTGGLGYRLQPRKGWSLGVRYYYGFVNVYKGQSGTKNSSFFLKATVPIGANQEKKKDTTN